MGYPSWPARGEFVRVVDGLRGLEASGVRNKILRKYVSDDAAAKPFRSSPEYKAWLSGKQPAAPAPK